MIATYILNCIRIWAYPYKVFQLNSKHFNNQRGIFSKIATDERVPEQWRLAQRYDDYEFIPDTWPVFFKPEWGSNASGVSRADNIEELTALRKEVANSDIKHLIQQSADGDREFEVFSIRHHQDKQKAAIFTITEARNESETNPVNSINNSSTKYVEVTQDFTAEQLEQLWTIVNQLGDYNISRASLSTNSITELLEGKFQVIEINLFLPMPINLLDEKHTPKTIFAAVRKYMRCLALVTKTRDRSHPDKPVFVKVMLYNRQNTFINFLRSKI